MTSAAQNMTMLKDAYIDMPAQVLDLLSKQIFSAFETADTLLEYEKDKKKPKGYFEEPVEFIDIDL